MLYLGDTGGQAVGDTWTWQGRLCTERAHFGPPACAATAMIFDNESALLYGGTSSLNAAAATLFEGSWKWDGPQHWTERQDIGPGPRSGHGMAFDSVRATAVLFGGSSGGLADAPHPFGDTWEALTGKAGSEEQGLLLPPSRSAASRLRRRRFNPARTW